MKVLFSICFDHREQKKIIFQIFFFIYFIAIALSIKVCLLFIPNAEHDYYFLIILNGKNDYYYRHRQPVLLLAAVEPTVTQLMLDIYDCLDYFKWTGMHHRSTIKRELLHYMVFHSFSSIKWIEHDVIVNYH